ncbi:DNA polymerase I [Woodsholea maritima]|uniref:DNA polymerase I n=1 Tax=Woodsholea maritima TaxID=240237 RepID=UPI00036D90DD|nr:DNA polymerase I [Woodsholea maritima]
MAVTRAIDDKAHVYLVDGSGYIFRAYHALPPLTRSDGTPVGAVQGFCNMLWKLLEDLKGADEPSHLAVIFDAKGDTFRNEIYPAYKANRPPAPEDLVPQFALIREATRAFDLPCIELEGYEADDIIATYACQARAQGARVTIVSSDKDLMQLVDDRITLLDTMKNKRSGPDEVREKFGVGPNRVIDVQSLAGDSVDNVPGVPGIGIKTAAQLIETYGDLEGLLSHLDEIKQPKRREKLMEHAEDARVSRQLVTLKQDVPLSEGLEAFGAADPHPDNLLPFMKAMEFRTLTRRVQDMLGDDAPVEADNPEAPIDRSAYETVQDEAALETWIAAAKAAHIIAVDTETDALSATSAGLVGISLATAPGKACYIPLDHLGGDLADGGGRPTQIDRDRALALLKPLLEDPSVLKVGQNFKYDLSVFARYGVKVAPYHDTMLISYVLEGGLHNHGMDELSELHLGHKPMSFKEVCGTGKSQKTFGEVDLKTATEYAAEDADVTLRLYALLAPRLSQQGKTQVYESLERAMPQVLSTMELAGIKVDVAQLSRLSSDFAQKMAEAEDKAHDIAGHPFNLASPKQIGDVLFGEMGLPGGKKTKTGAWSTDVKVLEELAAQGHDLPQALMDYRQFAKLKSTYSDALKEAINPATGRVHTSFSLAATSTGRLSSSEPNLQNIPIRTEEGRKIREAFIAEKDHILVAADYSQIELRLLAHIADVGALKQAFHDGVDIHALTASEMFGVALADMDGATRRKAKAINFGIIYGISAFGLANNLNIGRDEAKAYIESYFKKFPGIADYMEAKKAEAKDQGYVETIFGRRIHLPGIKDKNGSIRQFAERQAINAPIQGTAADIIRRAMIAMPAALDNAGLKSRMLLQVHDELVFEAPVDEADTLIKTVKRVMENAPLPAQDISVPLVVETGTGQTWGEAH